jgi:hypothetical protein
VNEIAAIDDVVGADLRFIHGDPAVAHALLPAIGGVVLEAVRKKRHHAPTGAIRVHFAG